VLDRVARAVALAAVYLVGGGGPVRHPGLHHHLLLRRDRGHHLGAGSSPQRTPLQGGQGLQSQDTKQNQYVEKCTIYLLLIF